MSKLTLDQLTEDRIRPSKLKPLSICSGMARFEAIVIQKFGKAKEAKVATLGNDLHNYASISVGEWAERRCELGESIAVACNQASRNGIDGWSVTCLQRSLEMVRDIIAKYDIKPENVLTEHRLGMDGIGLPRGGTADLILVNPERKLVIVIDYKFGFIDQGEADENDQTQAYALAAASKFHCDTVIVYLIQPRAEEENKLTVSKYDAESLRQSRLWIDATLRLARAKDPELTPHYDACLYCEALRYCPAAKEHIMRTLEAADMLGSGSYTADQWGNLVGAAKLAAKMSESINDDAKAHLKMGGSISGFKLGAPRAIRSVNDVFAAINTLQCNGIHLHELLASDAVSIKIGALKKNHYDIIEPFITEKLSEPSLVASKRGEK